MPTIQKIEISGVKNNVRLEYTDDDTNEILVKEVSKFYLIYLHPLVDHLYSFKPVGNLAENSYQLITLNFNIVAIYEPKNGFSSWNINFTDILPHFIDNLVAELLLVP